MNHQLKDAEMLLYTDTRCTQVFKHTESEQEWH